MNKLIEPIIKGFSADTKKILRNNLIAEYLFGSTARNDANEISDIDILIIVKQFNYRIRKELSGLASEYSINHGVCILPVIKDVHVWNKNKAHQTLFYQEIQKDGIRLC